MHRGHWRRQSIKRKDRWVRPPRAERQWPHPPLPGHRRHVDQQASFARGPPPPGDYHLWPWLLGALEQEDIRAPARRDPADLFVPRVGGRRGNGWHLVGSKW